VSPELRLRMEENPRQHRFTLVLTRGEDAKVILSGDKATCAAAPVVREAYSPELFAEMRTRRIAVLTYHKYPGTDWLEEEFREQQVQLSGGETVGMKLAERGTMLSNRLWVREVRKLSEGGRQTAILSTNYEADYAELAVSMFARWSQENFFKYMREHYGLDRLVEHGTETIPDSVRVVNPAWRKLDGQIRTLSGRRQRLLAQFAALGLEGDLSVSDVARYERKKAQLQEDLEHSAKQSEVWKQERKGTPHHVTIAELPEADRFTRLLPERKHFLDTIKLISYRAECSMAFTLREVMSRADDAHALLRQIYRTEADLLPDADAGTLTVCLHHLTQAAHDQALRHLCEELNATETLFPGTDLRLVYKIGSA